MPKGTPFDNVHISMFAVASTKSKLNIVHSTKKKLHNTSQLVATVHH